MVWFAFSWQLYFWDTLFQSGSHSSLRRIRLRCSIRYKRERERQSGEGERARERERERG